MKLKSKRYDRAVVECFKGGEMHSLFAVSRMFRRTSKEVLERYDEIKANEEYYNELMGLDEKGLEKLYKETFGISNKKDNSIANKMFENIIAQEKARSERENYDWALEREYETKHINNLFKSTNELFKNIAPRVIEYQINLNQGRGECLKSRFEDNDPYKVKYRFLAELCGRAKYWELKSYPTLEEAMDIARLAHPYFIWLLEQDDELKAFDVLYDGMKEVWEEWWNDEQ